MRVCGRRAASGRPLPTPPSGVPGRGLSWSGLVPQTVGVLDIVVAREAALEDWRRVHNAIIPTAPLTAAEVVERATRNRLTLAFAEGVLVGNATVRPPTDPDRICTVIVRVLPEHRRRGYGAAYLTHELAHARSLAPRRIETVVLASNTDGLTFARAQGFVEHERTTPVGDSVPFIGMHLDAGRDRS